MVAQTVAPESFAQSSVPPASTTKLRKADSGQVSADPTRGFPRELAPRRAAKLRIGSTKEEDAVSSKRPRASGHSPSKALPRFANSTSALKLVMALSSIGTFSREALPLGRAQ